MWLIYGYFFVLLGERKESTEEKLADLDDSEATESEEETKYVTVTDSSIDPAMSLVNC